jgi:hypothetical protein
MDRATFLKRLGLGALAAVAVDTSGLLAEPAEAAVLPVAELPVLEPPAEAMGDYGTASGGLCSPVTPFYTLRYIDITPIRERLLPSFPADRGGIKYERPPSSPPSSLSIHLDGQADVATAAGR